MRNKLIVVNALGDVYTGGLDSVGRYAGNILTSKEIKNSLGSDQAVTTLTSILPEVIRQKYYEITPSDYIPVEVGKGNPWDSQLLNWTAGVTGDDFESGLINMGSNNSNTPSDNIFVEPITRKVLNWKKNVSYDIFNENIFNQGTKRLDYIAELYAGRKKNYDLGIQKLAFYGSATDSTITGLLNMTGVNSNTTAITTFFSVMDSATFIAAVGALIPAYMANCNYTRNPDRFYIPLSDFAALAIPTSATFPVAGSSRLEVMERSLQAATGNPNFKVMPLAYSQKTLNSAVTGLNKNRYVLTNYDSESLRMDVPLPFTVTLPNSMDNFTYNSAAYSRFTGAIALRPLETLYLDHAV